MNINPSGPRPVVHPELHTGDQARASAFYARQLGAAVLLEPREGAGGSRSVVSSTAAGQVAFWQPKP
jgi:predicted enzyme related to lactoylglutathione lyase